MQKVRRNVACGALSLALLAAALAPSGALAAGTIDIDPAATEPAQSLNIQAGPGPLRFKVVSPVCAGASDIYVEVASQDLRDTDDTLADVVQKDRFGLSETSPGVYEGQTTSQWLQTPGTYFWLAYIYDDCGTAYPNPFVSPVRALVVTVPPPPPAQDAPVESFEDSEILSVAHAKAEVPGVILKKTKKVARGLKRKCARRGEGSILIVYCTISWHDNRTYAYNGSMRLARNDDGTLSVRFDGRRAKRACLKKKGGKRCYKKWKFSYAEL